MHARPSECLSVLEHERLSVTKSECTCMSGHSVKLTSAKLSGCAFVSIQAVEVQSKACVLVPMKCAMKCKEEYEPFPVLVFNEIRKRVWVRVCVCVGVHMGEHGC